MAEFSERKSVVELSERELTELVVREAETLATSVADFIRDFPESDSLGVTIEAENVAAPMLAEDALQRITEEFKFVVDDDFTGISLAINSITNVDGRIVVGFSYQPAAPTVEAETVETRHFSFVRECSWCGNVLTIEADLPLSAVGKVKFDKLARLKYRDWDYGEVPCTCVAPNTGRSRTVFLYEREYFD